jgi:hypothetical protein
MTCPIEERSSIEFPANNGEALLLAGVGNPVGSRELRLFDPVTTEAKAETEFTGFKVKSKDSVRRRPSSYRNVASYVSGFVDGEGCFCVSMRPQARIRVGWEVRPSFSVSQNYDRAEVIRLLPQLFECGSVRPDRSDKTLKFEVRSLRDLSQRVIPFFEKHPLLSSKQRDFRVVQSHMPTDDAR